MRLIRLKMVVLPAPFGPMIVKTSPASTLKLTPSRAWTPPKLMASSCASKSALTRPGSRSPQALRPHVRLLALEGGTLVEWEHREVQLDLHPPPVDAERLEEDEQHEDQAEDPRLEGRLLDEAVDGVGHDLAGVGAEHAEDRTEPSGKRVPGLRDG